jgi:DNA-binding transcriptional regulator YdaS (Cro superfamily)
MSNLNIAINYFGSGAKLAKAVGLDPMAVTQWKKRGIPPKRAKQIERLTNGDVKASSLLPDLFS